MRRFELTWSLVSQVWSMLFRGDMKPHDELLCLRIAHIKYLESYSDKLLYAKTAQVK